MMQATSRPDGADGVAISRKTKSTVKEVADGEDEEAKTTPYGFQDLPYKRKQTIYEKQTIIRIDHAELPEQSLTTITWYNVVYVIERTRQDKER